MEPTTLRWLPAAMRPRARVLAALAGRTIDRPAVVSPTSIATLELMDAVDASFPQAHVDAGAMARLAETAVTHAGFDTIMPVFSIVQESAALGCPVDWSEKGNWPTCSQPIVRRAEEITIPADVLKRPETRCVLESIAALKRRYGDDAAVIGKAMGPWTLGYHVYGTQQFLLRTVDDPDDVRRALDRLKELTVAFANAQLEAGADTITLPDHATGDLVRAKYYRDFLQEIHTELAARIAGPVILHICGATEDRMPSIRETGFAAFHFDSKNDARRSLALLDGRCRLVGNINNPRTLLFGTPEDVTAAVHAVLDAGLTMVGPECALPLACPLANLRAIPRAVETWQG